MKDYDRELHDEVKKFSCGKCLWTFISQEIPAQHMKRSHTEREFKELRDPTLDQTDNMEEEAHHCTECPLKFLTLDLLNKHQNEHLVEKFNKLNCICCSDKVSQVSDYANHLVGVYEMRIPDKQQELKFYCRNCELKFMSGNCLEYHLSRFHSPLARKKTWTNTNSTTDSSRTKSTSKDECQLCYETEQMMIQDQNQVKPQQMVQTITMMMMMIVVLMMKRMILMMKNPLYKTICSSLPASCLP